MRNPLVAAIGIVGALLLAPLGLRTPLAQPVAAASAPAPAANARVIVKYRADSALLRKSIQSASAVQAAVQIAAETQALGQRVGIALAAGNGIAERTNVVFASGITSDDLAARLAAQPDIEYAVPDRLRRAFAVPNDPLYATHSYNNPSTPTAGGPLVGQWYLKPPAPATSTPTPSTPNTAPAAIDAQDAWDITTGSTTVVVADLDTGVRFDHADLKTVANGGNLLPGYDMVSVDADGSFTTANDGNGRDADASDPGDFVLQADAGKGGCTQADVGTPSSWHGTETAGLIAALTDNAIGIASVGRRVRLLPVRVLGKCGGYDSDIVAGITWAAGLAVPGVPANADKARVINMSLGGAGACTQAYVDAIAQANAQGAVVVVSAGNSEGHEVSTPANCSGVIGVAGLRHIGTKVGFSDLGPGIAISAPGGNCVNTSNGSPCLYPIITTSNSGTTVPIADAAGGSVYSDAFKTSLGTSFSAPLVSGVVALMVSAQPLLTPDEVRFKLQQTARPFPTATVDESNTPIPVCAPPSSADQDQCVCTTSTCGAGMLDARAAVTAATGIQARIGVTPATPLPGQAVTLDASASIVPSGHTIASFQWTLSDGGGIVAALASPTTGPTVTATPSGPGHFSVTLTLTDNSGLVSAESTTITVAAPASSGGGGGALDPSVLLLLVAALVGLRTRPPAARRAG